MSLLNFHLSMALMSLPAEISSPAIESLDIANAKVVSCHY